MVFVGRAGFTRPRYVDDPSPIWTVHWKAGRLSDDLCRRLHVAQALVGAIHIAGAVGILDQFAVFVGLCLGCRDDGLCLLQRARALAGRLGDLFTRLPPSKLPANCRKLWSDHLRAGVPWRLLP